MKRPLRHSISIVLLLLVLGVVPAGAAPLVQCPTDTDGDGVSDDINVQCRHLSSGDGFVKMADGYDQYIFSFAPVPPDMPAAAVVSNFTGRAMSPAPTIRVKQGQELYLSLTNVGMIMHPDLFDAHSVHWHGFINAGSVFDGVPEVSPAANMFATQPYYYKAVKEGTFFYHCHVEASEHMQMGMIGNLYVEAGQDLIEDGTVLGAWTHSNTGDADNPPYGDFPGPGDVDLGTPGVFDEGMHDHYVYSDGDGSTYYDKDDITGKGFSFPIQLTTFDSAFHDASLDVQPLPFALMKDNYFLINGRGYPDTANPGGILNNASAYWSTDYVAQDMAALITAPAGAKISLRLSNVSTTDLITVATTLGVPMRVVGRGAELMRGPDGKDLSYDVSVLNIGGGQAADVIIDTAGVPAGTYFLYTTNLHFLSNNAEERGGIMTEIILN